jgi:hypothetical protein
VKCPFCDDLEDKVVDSRTLKQAELIRSNLNSTHPTGFASHFPQNSVVLQMDGAL